MKAAKRTRVYPSSAMHAGASVGYLDLEVVWQAQNNYRRDTYAMSIEQLQILRKQITEQLTLLGIEHPTE